MHTCPVTVRGKRFASIKAAARKFRLSERQAQRHLDKHGHLDFFGLPRKWGARPDLHRAVEIGPLKFESVTAAAQALGVDRKTILNSQHRESARDLVLARALQYATLKETATCQ